MIGTTVELIDLFQKLDTKQESQLMGKIQSLPRYSYCSTLSLLAPEKGDFVAGSQLLSAVLWL